MQIDERGWKSRLLAPALEATDRKGRLDQALSVFAAFGEVIRPLGLEIRQDWVSKDHGLAELSRGDDPPIIRLALLGTEDIPMRCFYRGTTRSEVPALNRAVLGAHLSQQDTEDAFVEWTEIRTMACEARGLQGQKTFSYTPLGRVTAIDGWFRPRECRHWPALTSPAAFEIFFRAGRVELRLDVRWPPWRTFGSFERNAVHDVLSTLARSGWSQ
ncbi:MAG: hypothetical protein AAGE52_41455 [Myxococcota bacterium]